MATILSDFLLGTVAKLTRFVGLDVHQQPKSTDLGTTLSGGDLFRKYFPSPPPFFYSLLSNSLHALQFLKGYVDISQTLEQPAFYPPNLPNVSLQLVDLFRGTFSLCSPIICALSIFSSLFSALPQLELHLSQHIVPEIVVAMNTGDLNVITTIEELKQLGQSIETRVQGPSPYSMSYYEYALREERWQTVVAAEPAIDSLRARYHELQGSSADLKTGVQFLLAAVDGLFASVERPCLEISSSILRAEVPAGNPSALLNSLFLLKIRILASLVSEIQSQSTRATPHADAVVNHNVALKVFVNFVVQEVLIPATVKCLQLCSQRAFDLALQALKELQAQNMPANPTPAALLKKLIQEKFWAENDYSSLKNLALEFGKHQVEELLVNFKDMKVAELSFHLGRRKYVPFPFDDFLLLFNIILFFFFFFLGMHSRGSVGAMRGQFLLAVLSPASPSPGPSCCKPSPC